jgi:phenylacetate-CoA ligase
MTKTQWNDAPGGFHPASAPDFLPRRELERLQLGRLQSVVTRAYEKVDLFRRRMEEKGLSPAAVKSLADLARLPFTVKADLRDTYPFGLFASPMEEIVRLHASSGTTGKPIVVAYTEADLQVWTSVMVRSLAACGLHKGDVIQNAYGYGLFTGGLGAHYGAEALGATVIPISGGNTERQLMVLQDFNVTAICCTPSYMVHLIERAKEAKIGFGRLKAGIFGAEPCAGTSRARPASRPTTSTASRRSSAPASGSSARARTGRTSSRITSTRRSSTRRPARCSPTARRASSSSPRSPSRRCR